MTLDEILTVVRSARRQGTGWMAQCPSHDDHTPSLKIDEKNGRVLAHCFAGCSYVAVMEACEALLNSNDARFPSETNNCGELSGSDLNKPPKITDKSTRSFAAEISSRKVVATYDYRDAQSRSLYQIVRFEVQSSSGSKKKSFIARRQSKLKDPEGSDEWVNNLEGLSPVLYNLPALKEADLVYVVEGEKDVETLCKIGLTATCNPFGAGKWCEEYSESLRDKIVAIIPDNDDPGRIHAESVAASLYGVAKEIVVISLPGVPEKGDVTDFVAAGGSADDLTDLIQRAASWMPRDLILHPSTGVECAMSETDSIADVEINLPMLSEKALYGLPGEIVRTIEPHTEAHPAALLVQLLAGFGCLIGRGAFFRAEADLHHMKLFLVLVGASSKGRKGTSWGHIFRLLVRVNDVFKEIIQDGLSSGEGLIFHVRDPQTRKDAVKKNGRVQDYEDVTVDTGATEKRVFVQEPEFARTLRVISRDGNTLSPVLRQAWDTDRLRIMTKNPIQATNSHISITGHITMSELRRNLDQSETANGFANRFLWIFTMRSKLLPFGGKLKDADMDDLVVRLGEAVDFASNAGELCRNEAGDRLWAKIYQDLSEGHPGLLGSVTSRGEPQVMRLASIYALMDNSVIIRPEHLDAGLAVWQYNIDSARYIFGDQTGDKLADRILSFLSEHNENGVSRTQLRDLFRRNETAARLNSALRTLVELGRIDVYKQQTDGRSAEMFRLRT